MTDFDAQRAALMEKIMDAFELSPEERELVEAMAAHARRAREMIEAERALFLAEIFAQADELCDRMSVELSDAMGIPIKVTFDRTET